MDPIVPGMSALSEFSKKEVKLSSAKRGRMRKPMKTHIVLECSRRERERKRSVKDEIYVS